ncbi:MAG: hypothetical protein RL481_1046 [Pseudomonadota bacterium]
MRAWLALLSVIAAPVAAQQLVTSGEPEAVSLTVYRAPDRGDAPIDPNWPQGYALITETRTVQIPAGESVIRFEGVAEGMFPESAIVTGLPRGVKEKNRDARLLSPSGLVDAYLKRAVTITRTSRASGQVREQQAMITAGPDGGVILQTADGFEALHCTGLPERMVYPGVPQNLSAKPTLSVVAQSDRAQTATLTLTYMAAGFDWQANYVTQVSGEQGAGTGKSKVDVFAWLTLANGGNQSFNNANTMAIAGEPNREENADQPRAVGEALNITCWPQQRTDQVPYNNGYILEPPYPAPPMVAYAPANAMDIVVTGTSMKREMLEMAAPVMVASQEDLGDLKLYRVPEPVTVNAKGQKQVAMIVKPGAKFDRLYTASMNIADGESLPTTVILRSENKVAKGLGLPMPSGQVMVFEDSNYGPLLAGESTLRDRAIGEEVELTVGESSDVRYRFTLVSQQGKKQSYRLEISNARAEPVNVEIEIPFELIGRMKDVSKVDGVPTWKTTIAANGDATLLFDAKFR